MPPAFSLLQGPAESIFLYDELPCLAGQVPLQLSGPPTTAVVPGSVLAAYRSGAKTGAGVGAAEAAWLPAEAVEQPTSLETCTSLRALPSAHRVCRPDEAPKL